METLLHNQIKNLFVIVVGGIVLSESLGRFFGDRMRLVNEGAKISTEPDAMFVSFKTMKAGTARWEEGGDSLEIVGTPDMVLEVVSSSSVQKDTVELRELYAAAGIREYWVVERLKGDVSFEILRLSGERYVATRKSEGWSKSNVLGRSFQLVPAKVGADNVQDYRLQVK
jgi:Uma2 family endonuclease